MFKIAIGHTTELFRNPFFYWKSCHESRKYTHRRKIQGFAQRIVYCCLDSCKIWPYNKLNWIDLKNHWEVFPLEQRKKWKGGKSVENSIANWHPEAWKLTRWKQLLITPKMAQSAGMAWDSHKTQNSQQFAIALIRILTVSAPVRFKPRPPMEVVKRSTSIEESPLNWDTTPNR